MEFTLNINLNNSTELDKAKDNLSNTTGQEINTGSSSPSQASKNIKKDDKKKSSTAGVLAYEIGKSAVQQISSYAISSYGTKFGDVARQNSINNAVTIGTEAAKVGALIVTQNWALLALEAANQAIQAFQRYDQFKDLERDRTVNEIRQSERLGIVSTDRNRGA